MSSIIYYAGQSERRTASLARLAGVTEVKSVGGGEEPETPNVLQVAFGKIAYALPLVLDEVGRLNGHMVLAADARTELKMGMNGNTTHVSKGKPRDEEEVFEHFQRMARVESPGYRLRAGSVAYSKRGVVHDSNTARVTLTSQGVHHLSTSRGFDEYGAAYREFYSTPPYSSHDLTALDFTHISSGLSLPVLMSLGMVEGLGVDSEPEEVNNHLLKAAIFTVAVGFGPNVLREIHPDALESVMAWSWLNEVADKVSI